MKKRIIFLIFSIIIVLIVLSTSTYALFFGKDKLDNQEKYTTGLLDIVIDNTDEGLGNNLTLTNSVPMSDDDGKNSTPYKFKIKNIGNLAYVFDLKLISTTSSNEVNSNYIKIMIDDAEPVRLSDLQDSIIVSNLTLNPSSSKIVSVRIWLDENTPNTEMGKSFSAKITADGIATDDNLPNPPKLTDGMIPVKYDGSKWVKASSSNANNDWYNYANKMWANAVLVSETNRSSYVNASVGTEIPENDVLAYYVWIPRYKYKVWNINKVIGTDSYNAQTTGIDIVFEKGTETTGTITCGTYGFAAINDVNTRSEECSGSNGEYYTHPAFTFGEDELEGIWVGKFEISSNNPNASYGGGNVTNLSVRIKPNVTSWRYNKIDNFYTVIKNMQNSNNEYGLVSNKVDSHMMKNIEWGAISYLTYSKYGVCSNNICSDVYKNNSNSCITGNSGTEIFSPSISNTTLKYNENKYTKTVTGGTTTTLSPTLNDSTYPWTESGGIWSSSNANVASSTSKLTYNFTNNTDAVMKLIFSVSSNYLNYFRLYLDGIEIMSASDTIRGTEESSLRYDTFLYEVSSGTHTIEVSFNRGTTNSVLNKAYIKSLEIIEGATIEVTHSDELGGQMASTTFNESGIYDMNGGAWEYQMANMSSTSGSYQYNKGSAGANYLYNDSTVKYIDRYVYGTEASTQMSYNRAKLGDATGELVIQSGRAWTNDIAMFAYSDRVWFARSGCWYHDSSSASGIFYFHTLTSNGNATIFSTTRASLIVY